MPPTSSIHRCFNCGSVKPTAQGLRSHLSQRAPCRQAFLARAQLSDPDPTKKDSNCDVSASEHNNDNSEHIPHTGIDDQHLSEPPSKRAHVEDVEDLEAGGLPKDPYVRYHTSAGKAKGKGESLFELLHQQRERDGLDGTPWAPFDSEEEWDLARWLIKSGLSHSEIDKYLRLNIVSTSLVFF